jgi:hypothetical protein
MKALLATLNKSVLSKYQPLAALGTLMPNIPTDHLLVLIAFAYSGLQSQKLTLTKEILSKVIQQTFNEYKRGKFLIEKNGDEYYLYDVQ